ncbi:flagellar basal body-associated FliL family protein [Stomatohabitans albus]|uniref:flagellar basal body-associated FliL family protein n=1 Tax=Stomatohabitans albus TaxID=3110766 RepID=UPI00300C2122
MAKKEQDVQDEQPTGGKKKKLILIALVLVVIIGAVVAYLWFKTPLIGPDPNATNMPTEAVATHEPPLAEKTVNIDSITVNLAQNSGFLKVSISVQFGPEVDQATFSTSAINDEIIKLYSRLSVQELSDPAIKEVAKDHLRERLNELYGADAVSAVYYTEFVTQSV